MTDLFIFIFIFLQSTLNHYLSTQASDLGDTRQPHSNHPTATFWPAQPVVGGGSKTFRVCWVVGTLKRRTAGA